MKLSVDANQAWERDEAIAWVAALAPYDVYWVEEPTSPDDVLAHAAIVRAVHPIKVATGEHMANRVMFKQFLAAGALGVCQLDACRVAGVNENVAILLLAAKFGVPVCPHAGGVGLCEVVQHLAMFDYVAVSGSHGGALDRVRRSPARALRESGARRRRALRSPGGAGRQRRDAARVGSRVQLPRRAGLAGRGAGELCPRHESPVSPFARRAVTEACSPPQGRRGGWVRDGSSPGNVLVHAEGERGPVEELVASLGSEAEVQEVPAEGHEQFAIRG